MATVMLPRLLDTASGGRRVIPVDGRDVDAVIRGLLEKAPALEVHLFDRHGNLRPHVMCFIDGEPSRLTDRQAPVTETTEIRFLQAVSGG